MQRARSSQDASGRGADLVIRCSREAADEVVGEAEIGSGGTGSLIGLAEDLSGRGIALQGLSADAFDAIEIKTTIFRTCRDDVVVGRAVPLHVGSGMMVWQTTISARSGEALALVQQTFVPSGASPAVPSRSSALTPVPPPSATATTRMEAILAAGSRVIAERGFANATTKEIAAAAGMTAPTMYQYVRSKDELLFLICDACFRDLSERVDEAAASCSAPDDRLRASMGALIEASETRRSDVRLLSRESASLPPPLRAKVHRRWNEFLTRFSAIVAEGTAAGTFRPVDPDLASHLIEALCDIWALRRVALRRHGFEKSKAEILDLVLRGLAAEPDRAAPSRRRPDPIAK